MVVEICKYLVVACVNTSQAHIFGVACRADGGAQVGARYNALYWCKASYGEGVDGKVCLAAMQGMCVNQNHGFESSSISSISSMPSYTVAHYGGRKDGPSHFGSRCMSFLSPLQFPAHVADCCLCVMRASVFDVVSC